MKVYAVSDKGMVRQENQDSFVTGTTQNGSVFAAVCDGMGGVSGGKLASTIAADTIHESLFVSDAAPAETVRILGDTLKLANTRIHDASSENPELQGMGTTAVLVIASDEQIHVANIGDSRAYLISKTAITSITKDHSAVQELVDKGMITSDQAKMHPQKHLITRALGVEKDVMADIYEYPFENGQVVMLCSDGLVNMVEDKEIFAVFNNSGHNDYAKCADELIKIANKRGGRDNITVVLIVNA